jgi:hypothetical protein
VLAVSQLRRLGVLPLPRTCNRIYDVVVLVAEYRQHRVCQRVCLVAVERHLVNDVLAARVHHDVIRLQEFDAILDATGALDARHDLREAITCAYG